MVTPKSLIRRLQGELAAIDSPAFEAKMLVKNLLHLDNKDILDNLKIVSEADEIRLIALAKKRNSAYPLQYILGEWEFYGLPIKVGEGVLIPRADTETLCDAVLKITQKKEHLRILDICSGSGCIALALEKYSSETNSIFALEKSAQAIHYLKENLALHNSRITLVEDDALSPKTANTGFDIIVSNPPYLSESDMENLQKEVSFEPEMALLAPPDGYYFYENLTAIWKERMVQNGTILYEVGIGESARVSEILRENGFFDIDIISDLNGVERVVLGKIQSDTNT